MKPTQDQIDLIDKLFLIVCRPINGLKPGHDLIRKELQVPKDLFQFLYNTMCEIGHKEEILIARQLGYGDYEVVTVDKIKSKLFIDQGGFNGYFERENSFQTVIQNNFKITNSKSLKISWLKIVYWLATICLALVTLYGLLKGLFKI